MEKAALEELRLVWNSLYWADALEKADVIIGFGCADEAVGQRAAELYLADTRHGWCFPAAWERVPREGWR